MLKKNLRKKCWKKNFGIKFWKKKFEKNFGKKNFKKMLDKSCDKQNYGKTNYKTKIFIIEIYSNIDKYHERQGVMKTSAAYVLGIDSK